MVALAILASKVGSTANAGPPRDHAFLGDWRIGPDRDDRRPALTLHRSWRHGSSHGSWSSTFDLDREQLVGITPEQWGARDVPVAFEMKREAGSFHFQGRL